MRIVLLGAPGSGKGTQGQLLAGHFGVPYLSSGEVLRAIAEGESETARRIAAYLRDGELVPDELVSEALESALRDLAAGEGYVLEGFPRTVAQARHADEVLAPDAVVLLAVPDEVARARLAGRADVGRSDDASRGAIERRLGIFHDEIGPMLEHYRRRGVLTTVDADQTPGAVQEAIRTALGAGRGS
jgi:adenylate kinase